MTRMGAYQYSVLDAYGIPMLRLGSSSAMLERLQTGDTPIEEACRARVTEYLGHLTGSLDLRHRGVLQPLAESDKERVQGC